MKTKYKFRLHANAYAVMAYIFPLFRKSDAQRCAVQWVCERNGGLGAWHAYVCLCVQRPHSQACQTHIYYPPANIRVFFNDIFTFNHYSSHNGSAAARNVDSTSAKGADAARASSLVCQHWQHDARRWRRLNDVSTTTRTQCMRRVHIIIHFVKEEFRAGSALRARALRTRAL